MQRRHRSNITAKEHQHQIIKGIQILTSPGQVIEISRLVIIQRLPNFALAAVLIGFADLKPKASGKVEVQNNPEDKLEQPECVLDVICCVHVCYDS